MIVAGRLRDEDAAGPIAALSRATGFPLLAEPTSQLRLGGHDRDRLITRYDHIARERPASLAPDLILRFGEMPSSKPLRTWIAALPEAAQLVVDPTRGWNEPSRQAGAMVRAEPAALATALAERAAAPGGDPAFAERWLAAERAVDRALRTELATAGEPTEPGLQLALGEALADGDLVYTASSMPIRDQEAFLPAGDADALFLANRGANGIDGLVSSGIGAAHASGRPTVIVTGDLGLLHDVGGLFALSGVSAPVRIVVVNNDGGGIFEFLPQAEQLDRTEFEALLGTPRALEVERVAALFGLSHTRLENLEELDAALRGGSGLIEVRIDRSANLSLHRRLAERAASALADALG